MVVDWITALIATVISLIGNEIRDAIRFRRQRIAQLQALRRYVQQLVRADLSLIERFLRNDGMVTPKVLARELIPDRVAGHQSVAQALDPPLAELLAVYRQELRDLRLRLENLTLGSDTARLVQAVVKAGQAVLRATGMTNLPP